MHEVLAVLVWTLKAEGRGVTQVTTEHGIELEGGCDVAPSSLSGTDLGRGVDTSSDGGAGGVGAVVEGGAGEGPSPPVSAEVRHLQSLTSPAFLEPDAFILFSALMDTGVMDLFDANDVRDDTSVAGMGFEQLVRPGRATPPPVVSPVPFVVCSHSMPQSWVPRTIEPWCRAAAAFWGMPCGPHPLSALALGSASPSASML
jgi:hypothetical protein